MATRGSTLPGQTNGAPGVTIMPADITFRRPGRWSSDGAFHRARSQWLQAHGIDASDWSAGHPGFRASRRAHAHTVAELDCLERSRRLSAGASRAEPT
jgi:hypothetical protein